MNKIQFTTQVTIPKSEVSLNYNDSLLLLGSCFAQNIGNQLKSVKFKVTVNPFGIIYNPISIVKTLQRIIKNEHYTNKELIQFGSKWFSFDHHSSFSNTDKQASLATINDSIQLAHEQLKKSKIVFITLGSAWVYEYEDFGIVANCHKIPNKNFKKRLLSVKEIIGAFEGVLNELKMILNPNINLVFTVSPVRHVKDGLHENNLSKATLHLAVNNVVNQNENCHYFPAYELVVDELRDYRFYKDDLVHPTTMAVNYVWEKLLESYVDETTKTIIERVQKVQQAAQHLPFDFKSTAHQQFIKKQLQLIDSLSKQYSFLDFEEEKLELCKDSQF